jgi:ATP phosphoribosyltransferase regulatory subunit
MDAMDHHGVRGFGLRAGEDSLTLVRAMRTFYEAAAARDFVPLKLALAHPPDTFIGPAPRPIRPKDAARVLRGVTPEGATVAIRYEGTAPTARHVAACSRAPGFVGARFAYFDEMCRLEMEEDLDDRHMRTFHQAGLECFHADDGAHCRALIDLLRVNRDWASAMGATLKIRVSHVRLFAETIVTERVGKHEVRELKEALESAPEQQIEGLLESIGARPSLRDRILDLAALRDVPLDNAVRSLERTTSHLLEPMRAFTALVESSGLGDVVRFDAGILRSLHFYSGLTFQGDIDGAREVMGGGEYTGLAEAFGARGPLHAVGTAIGVERLQSVTTKEHARAA